MFRVQATELTWAKPSSPKLFSQFGLWALWGTWSLFIHVAALSRPCHRVDLVLSKREVLFFLYSTMYFPSLYPVTLLHYVCVLSHFLMLFHFYRHSLHSFLQMLSSDISNPIVCWVFSHLGAQLIYCWLLTTSSPSHLKNLTRYKVHPSYDACPDHNNLRNSLSLIESIVICWPGFSPLALFTLSISSFFHHHDTSRTPPTYLRIEFTSTIPMSRAYSTTLQSRKSRYLREFEAWLNWALRVTI